MTNGAEQVAEAARGGTPLGVASTDGLGAIPDDWDGWHKTATKRKIIERALHTMYLRSDRSLGALLRVDPKTVAAVRRKLERSGVITVTEKRNGKDGRNRPAGSTRAAPNVF